MRTTTPEGLWIETRGKHAEIGLGAADRGGKPLTRIETVGKGARLRQGGAFLLLTYGKGRAAQEVEIDAPIAGRIVAVDEGVAKATSGSWIVRVELAGAVEEDEEEDEGDVLDELLDDDDED